ncbi:MAG: AAA family ATPase [Planctomycetales bacterium]|nr:AAA family ATPase [Planctomycetales bacterium]
MAADGAAAAAYATGAAVEAEATRFREAWGRIRAEIERVIVGHAAAVDEVLLSLFAGGHVLIEGVPGLGKTLLVRTLATALKLEFRRIQFTPDLMPADVTGTTVLDETPGGGRSFRFQQGPVFGQAVLADEVNRATPKTQSALLEAMQESAVTVGGVRHALPRPFFVLATENPIEMEGTYPLPEAQLDRFLLKIEVGTPTEDDLVEILRRTTGGAPPEPAAVCGPEEVLRLQAFAREVPVPEPVARAVARLVRATHPDTPCAPEAVRRFVRYGASPRGAQAIQLAGKVRALARGRLNLAFEDVRAVALPALRHRILRNFEAEAEGMTADRLVGEAQKAVPELAGR